MFDVSDDLISLSTNKAYGRAAGTWQIMLTYKTVTDAAGKQGRYNELITPDDTITIELDAGDGNGMKAVMLGLVDRVSVVRMGGNNPQRQVKISGQDMGKLLVKHDIGWDIAGFNLKTAESGDSTNESQDRQLNRQFDATLTTGTPPSLISKLFKQTFTDVLPIWAPKFLLDITSKDGWMLWNPPILTLQGCSIWAALTHCMHEPFNVLTTETRDTKTFVVTLEEQPITDEGQLKRDDNRKHTIFDADIISDDVGICDAERINLLFYKPEFYLSAAGMTVAVAMAHPDLVRYHEDSIKNHGYCPKTIQDQFVPPEVVVDGPPTTASWMQTAKTAVAKLWSWFQFNHTYWSGMFQLHLRPDIKAGDGLIQDIGAGKKKEYLIEQVAHQYVVWPQPIFVTTLHVTRGQDYVG